jgi:MFS family permease
LSKADFYGWKLLAVFWLVLFVNLAFPAYGTGVINTYMAAALHVDRKMMGLPYSVYMLMSGLPAPLVALAVNRKGVRFTVLVGTGLIMAGSLLMAMFVAGILGAALAFGVLVGGGVATGGALATQTGVTYWFVRRRALALAILLSGGGIGGFVATWVLNKVIIAAGEDWRAGWWVIAGLSALVGVLVAVFVKERPEDLGQSPDGVQVGARGQEARAQGGGAVSAAIPAHITREAWTFNEVIRSPHLWMMLLCTVGVSAGFTLVITQGLAHLRDLGHSITAGSQALGTMTLATILAKLVVAALGDRMDPRYLWAAFTVVFGAGLLFIVHASGARDLYPFAICLGAGFGGMLVCQMAVWANYYGLKAYASVVGLALAVQTLIGALAPYIGGWVYDSTHSYSGCFYVLAGACLVSAAILFTLRPPVRKAPLPAVASHGSSAGVPS